MLGSAEEKTRARGAAEAGELQRLAGCDLLVALALALLAGVAILPGLGKGPLISWDESIYGVLVREFLARPSLTLSYGGGPYFEKPPLGVWCMAASAWVLGLDELALRLPAAAFGVGTVLLTFFAGLRIGGRAAGVLAALLLLGVPQFVAWSRLAMLDVPLVFFLVLSVVLALEGGRRPHLTIAAGAALGLAIMTKWIAAFLFLPGLIALVAARGGARSLLRREVALGALAAALVGGAWHAQQVIVHGRAFFDTYIFWNTFQRATRPLEAHEGGRFHELKMYAYNTGTALALVHAMGVALATALAVRRRDGRLLALAILAVGAFAGVSAMRTKIGWYLTPVYAGAALASGVAFASLLDALLRRTPRSATPLGEPRGLRPIPASAGMKIAGCGLAVALAVPGARLGRSTFVEDYNVFDRSPEIAALLGKPPFERRVPLLYVHVVSEPAAHYYLAERVEEKSEGEFEWLPVGDEPFLCLTFEEYAQELLDEHPGRGLEIFARSGWLTVVGRRAAR